MTQIAQKRKEDPQTCAIIGAAMAVHSGLGCGFLEPVYREALGIEFEQRGIPFAAQVELPITYRGRQFQASYRADFICFGSVIVELKALRELSGTEEAQILNYLKATGLRVGLLLNFGMPSLKWHRLVHGVNSESEQSAESVDDLVDQGASR